MNNYEDKNNMNTLELEPGHSQFQLILNDQATVLLRDKKP